MPSDAVHILRRFLAGHWTEVFLPWRPIVAKRLHSHACQSKVYKRSKAQQSPCQLTSSAYAFSSASDDSMSSLHAACTVRNS